MIKASHHPWYEWFFSHYFRWIIKKQFRIVFHEPVVWHEMPTLWIANHTSWWDGIVLKVFHESSSRVFHAMMLEEELKKNPFLARLGAFSVRPGSRSILESLKYAAELLQKPKHTVLFFPQGKIHSLYSQNVEWMPGVNKLTQQMPEKSQVLFSVMLPDYGSYSKPTLCVYHQLFELSEVKSHLEQAFQHFQAESVKRHEARLGNGHFTGWSL